MEISELTIIGKRKAAIEAGIAEALAKAADAGELSFARIPDFIVEVPRDPDHGEFATNAAMLLAKEAKCPPRSIAAQIIKYFSTGTGGVDSLEVAGPGFINFRMKKDWLALCLKEILAEGDTFGSSSFGKGQKIQVEFVSANPTGELHIGNARGAAIGDTLSSLLQMAGYEVQREFYINDAGNQIEKFGYSLEARYLQALGEDVPFPEDGYHGEDVRTAMAELAEEVKDKYQAMESPLRRELLTSWALKKKISSIHDALEKFGVNYDVWFSEQTLHDSGAIVEIVEKMQKEGWVYEKDDALWLDCRRFGEEKDEVLVRSNGIPTYFAADIAYHDNKFKRGFDTVIDIWGADHHGHVARMKGAMEALGYSRDQLEVILMQFVRLYEGGELLRMSKRTGTYVTLEELVEEVGCDAARFFFVNRSADSLIDFDMDLAKSQSADNPVFYVQYAHARICSILANAQKEGYHLPHLDKMDLSCLQDPSELALIRRMADFPDEVARAAMLREPHHIASYVQEMASTFHHFYSQCRVLGEAPELTFARLWLARGVATILERALAVMGVDAPEKM